MPVQGLTSTRADHQESVSDLAARANRFTTTPPTAAVTPPHRSHTQRMDALRNANEIRSKRAEVKRHVKQHKDPTPLVAQLEQPSRHFETMKVIDLLLSLPKVGRVKASKILRTCAVSPSKTVGGLSERQRRELLRLLPAGVRELQEATS